MTGTSEGAEAKAGQGAPPEPRPSPAPSRKRRGGRKRGDSELDPEMERLVREVGRSKVVPDSTAIERHYTRSLRFRHLVMEFLLEAEGTTWADLGELHARAANYAGCASQTAARWVYQLTRVGGPFRLVEAVDHWILERRDG